MTVPFNRPLVLGGERECVAQAIRGGNLAGNGAWCRKCSEALGAKLGCRKAIMTPSCTDALEMSALLCSVGPGDEVIMPSYTFVTTASAFALRGARIVWCDIRPDTKNIDEAQLEALVTERTKAVVAVHYAGVGCEMDALADVCRRHALTLVEDAAQAIDCAYKGRALGSFGDVAAFSFHETKNIHCGEGGALIVNHPDLVERAELVRDKGTNRSQFVKGLADKYTWVELGSSFLMSELQAAFLLPQLERSQDVNARRLEHWRTYHQLLSEFMPPDALPFIPAHCRHNGHMFYILLEDLEERNRLIEHLKAHGVRAHFHYVPLHRAPYWEGRYSRIALPVTESISARLLRLPMYHALTDDQIEHVCAQVRSFTHG